MKSFVYKWTHKPSLKWYVGFHVGESNDGYICSNPIKDLIKENPEDWERTIVDTGTPEAMYELETIILQTFDARNDVRSFNGNNNNGGYTPGWNKGIPMKEESKLKIIAKKTGKPGGKLGKKYPGCHSPEAREKKRQLMIGDTRNKGKPWSEARRAAQVAKQKAKLIFKGE